MKIKSVGAVYIFAIISFVLHLILGWLFFAEFILLILLIHLFLLVFICLYILVLSASYKRNKTNVLPSFMLLTFIKLLLSVVVVLGLNEAFNLDSTLIVLNFFSAFFVYLFLQVRYSVNLLQ